MSSSYGQLFRRDWALGKEVSQNDVLLNCHTETNWNITSLLDRQDAQIIYLVWAFTISLVAKGVAAYELINGESPNLNCFY